MMMPNQVTLLSFRRVAAIVACAAGALIAAATGVNAQTVSAPLTVSTLAGSAGTRQATDGAGATARFFGPAGLTFDQSGNLVVADSCNNLIRKVTPAGVVTTFAGSPINPPSVLSNIGHADGAGAAASFQMGSWQSSTGAPFDPPNYANPGSITIGRDSSGNLYLADTNNYTIRKITPAGVVSTLAGSAGANGTDDGSGGSAKFLVPGGAAVDSHGNIFVTDSGNDTIRKITPDGTVSTFAGTARAFGSTDGTGSAARFTDPEGIVIDSSDNLYVTDSGNHTIRKITPAGVVTTLAGSAGHAGTADGSASQARFNGPLGIALDSSGNLYVADTKNNAIRKITPAGTVTTVAGSKGVAGSADGTGTNAQFSAPTGIVVDGNGVVYISDFNNNTIRRGVVDSASGSLTITEVPPALVQVVATSNVTLKVAATGNPSPTYQWSKNGVAISGATGSSLALNSVSTADMANYSVLVSSNLVTFSTSPTQLQVFPANTPVPITIVAQPADRTLSAGQSTTFTVEATSDQPNLSYQWSKGGTPINGATNASYSIGSVQTSDGGVYTVTISDGVNTTVTTSGATLAVVGGAAPQPPAITVQPIPQTAALGGTVSFSGAASGSPAPTYQWQKNGVNLSNGGSISGATTSTLTITGVTASDAGDYKLVATNSAGTALSNAAALTLSSTLAPSFTTQPASQTVNVGANVTFTAAASGTPAPTYEWKKGGATVANSSRISGANSASLTITGVTAADAGDYTLVATNSAGSATSNAATLTVNSAASPNAWLTNVSVRTTMTVGQDPVIVGFGTNGPKTIVVRAAGPALSQFITGTLADPSLQLYKNGDPATVVAANDNWDSSLAPVFASVGAFGFEPGSKDAAYLQSIDGSYTTWELPTGAGVVLIEAYDAAPNNSATRLVNISARNRVGTGGDILIAGFAIQGTGTKRLLIRAVGPKLADFQVSGVLADPKLEIYNGANELIASNDNWDAVAIGTTAKDVGAFDLTPGSKDAAIIVELQAGSPPATYTAQVKGVADTTGVALVEVYEIP